MVKRGLWIDDAPRRACTEEYVDELAELGFTSAWVMIWDVDTKVLWEPEEFQRFDNLCEDRSISVGATIWPRPHADYIQDLRASLKGYEWCAGSLPMLECDLEGQWKPSLVHGFDSLEEAGAALVDALPGDMEVTTFPGHAECSPNATVSQHASRLVVQAYSVSRRGGKPVDYHSRLGPGRFQRKAIAQARKVNPRIVVGLPAYKQKWPGRDPLDAMRDAYRACEERAVQEVRYWSSKWILGGRALSYPREFFESL